MSYNNHPLVNFTKTLAGIPGKGPEEPFRNIFHIADAVADIFVIDLFKNFSYLF